MVRYAILGPIELCDGKHRRPVRGPRQVALLALLLLNANRVVSSDRLIEALWGDLGPAGAVKRLQVAILRLRRVLDPAGGQGESVLQMVTGGYLLTVAPGELDTEVFQAHVDDGLRALQAGEAACARDMLREALAVWRGPALHEVAYEQFAQTEIRRLDELRMAAVQARVDCDLRLGEHGRVIGELEALVAEHPGREQLAEQLMLALYRGGRQGDALEVYAHTRAYLSDELGLEPGAAMKALQRAILEQAPALTPASARASEPRRPPRTFPRALQPTVGHLPFTGRDDELAFLTSSWADVDDEARRVVVLAGEAGIGKTRVAAELAATVHDEGSLVLYGRCDEGLAVPYQPFVEALRSVLPMLDVDQLRGQLGRLAPELGRLVPELTGFGSPSPADAESARFALFEAVVALLEVASAQQRMLLVVDDVQWAAPATLLLLRHVIRSERPLALLILVTFRSTELGPDEPLAELLADLQRDNNSPQRIVLSGLDEQAIDTLLTTAIGRGLADQPVQLAARVHAQTGGNPFFVRELVAHLLETGALTSVGEGTAASPPPAKLGVPEGLRSVVCHRVARLSKPARQLMTIASVAAGTIDISLLHSVLPEHSGLLDALDETVAAGLLVEGPRGEVDFAHALVRQTVYDDLSTARRLHLHRCLGEALEVRSDTQEHVEALARHFGQLVLDGESDKAIGYAIAAGHAATARLAYEDAAAHFQRGLDIVAQTQEPHARRHIDLLLALGQARWSTGESDKARAAFKHAADIAHSIGDAAAADAALGFSGPLFFDVEAASARSSQVLLQRALAMLDEDHSALRARLMGRLAAAHAYAGGQHDHRALAYDALTMARQANDKRALAEVLATCSWVTRGPDDPDQQLQMTRELTRLAEEVDDVRLLAYARVWVTTHLLEQAEIDGVLRELDHLEQLAQTRNDRYARWLQAAIHAMLAHIQGKLQSAESFALEALGQWVDRPQFAPPAQMFAGQIFVLRREQGRLDELVELVVAVVEQSPEVPAWHCALADMYTHVGDRDCARRELELLGDLSNVPRDPFWLTSIVSAGTAASFLEDHSRGRQAYELLLPHAHTCVVNPGITCEGSTSRPLGMLATTLGRYDDAELHFERALEMNAKIRSPLWTAHTQYEHARMLRVRGRPGDHDRARALLATATATADELGLRALSRACISLRTSS